MFSVYIRPLRRSSSYIHGYHWIEFCNWMEDHTLPFQYWISDLFDCAAYCNESLRR